MARNDGVDRTSVRNLAVSDKAVGNTQQHNEREKDSYRNPDIIPQRTSWNVHFKILKSSRQANKENTRKVSALRTVKCFSQDFLSYVSIFAHNWKHHLSLC